MEEFILEMEKYASINKIPIIEKESINFIIEYIKKNHIKNILEIGSAIGYSAILMANVNEEINVTTIERDENRYIECLKNIKKCGFENRINTIFDDAFNVDLSNMKFDMIFIDAAKGQYIKFFEKFKNLLDKNGVIITDNLKFHGYVGNSKIIESKNLRGLVRKIENYIDFLNNNDSYITIFYNIGDGISISKKR